MFDTDIQKQLESVFSQLENKVELVYANNNHKDLPELLDMLNGISSSCSKISVRATTPSENAQNPNLNAKANAPYFQIHHGGKPTGMAFQGIPGGHEFTSLILSILFSDKKGKFPDPLLIDRVQRLKGPIEIKTFISLSCENCPDVVQALNQMAVIHPNFKHTMVDGGYTPDEIQSLGIQGVPSIVTSSKLIHSGRIHFLDLLTKLEETFGTTEGSQNLTPKNLGHFDVLVIGGGPAGASAAIYSVRKGLKTALITEKIGGQVQETKGIENLISVTYTEGPQLAAQIQQHLSSYPVQIFEHRRVKEISKDKIKEITLESGETLTADSVIVTTGAKWRELGIPGEKEYIGRGVAFCPHCDGPYYKGKKVAVIGGGNSGVEAAIDLAGIVKEVVLFEYQVQLKADAVLVQKLKSLSNVTIITGVKTTQILGDGQKVHHLEYVDRKTETKEQISLDGVFVQIGLIPNSHFLKGKIELSPFGEIIVDAKGHTSEPGIYAAGDVTTSPYKQIIIAMGDGAKVALAAFEDRMLQH